MNLKVLGSGSSGNCYILETESEALIIEAGIRFLDVKKSLDFRINKIVGCLVSHKHNDHAKYAKELVNSGIHLLTLQEVIDEKKLTGSNVRPITSGKGYKLGKFKVFPFNANHDVPCVGFLIDHPECGRIFFLTDSCTSNYVFNDINHVLIECNYSDKKLIENINKGNIHRSHRERLINSHMELNTCKGFFRNIDIKPVVNVVLLHLSNNNSDEPLFVSEIQKLTGKEVYSANPGLTIDLTL